MASKLQGWNIVAYGLLLRERDVDYGALRDYLLSSHCSLLVDGAVVDAIRESRTVGEVQDLCREYTGGRGARGVGGLLADLVPNCDIECFGGMDCVSIDGRGVSNSFVIGIGSQAFFPWDVAAAEYEGSNWTSISRKDVDKEIMSVLSHVLGTDFLFFFDEHYLSFISFR